MEGARMRIVTAVVVFLILAARPALSSEVFVAQVNKVIAAELAVAAPAKSMASSELLALPVKLNAIGLQDAAVAPGANTSALLQSGANNLAVVAQSGGGNASTILQHGNGNQAMV